MNIKICSDSTCDLSKEIVEKYNIEILPLTVVKGGDTYLDNVNITPADIFAHVAAGGDLCSTTALNIEEYTECFSKFCGEYDGIIHINISSEFSSCHQNARLAAEDFENVRVVDSRNLSTGQGLVVLKACELAKTCESLDEIYDQLVAFTEKVEASFLLDQLKYMVKGGRCSAVAALGANLLNLKPCIEVKNGKMGVVKKYRGSFSKCVDSYTKDRLADPNRVEHTTLAFPHTLLENGDLAAAMHAAEGYGPFENVLDAKAGCTVSCHCGPGTLGIVCLRK